MIYIIIYKFYEFFIKDPVNQFVFIFKVVVKALAVHAAFLADVCDGDLIKRKVRKLLF